MPENLIPAVCPLFGDTGNFPAIDTLRECTLYKCPDCGVEFWYPIKAVPEKDFYETSKMYEFVKKRPLAWYHCQFIDAPPAYKGSLLDVGFGQGEFLDAVRSRLPAVEYWGVDLAERNVIMARESYGLERLHAGSLDAFLNAQKKQFDAVTAFEVIEHVPDPAAFVASVARALRVGGIFALSTPNLDRFGGSGEGWDFPPNHLFRWNSRVIKRLLESNGFRVIRVTEQPFTRDFFFNKGFLSFGFMRRLRARETVVEDGVGAIVTGRPTSRFMGMVGASVGVMAIIKNAFLRAVLLPVEWIFRLCGIRYWDLYVVAERI